MDVEAESPTRHKIAALLIGGEKVRRDLLLPDPAPISHARYELDFATESFGRDTAARRVIQLVDLWTMLAGDHLRGIGVLLEDATTVFPTFPLLQAVVEHSAWVCWLLDADIDTRSRWIRAALADLRSDEEAVGVAKRWGGPNSPAYVAAKQRYSRTRQGIIQELGHLDTQNAIDGESTPRPTAVVEHFGTCEGDERQWVGTYAYLCGTATHPSRNAFEFVEVAADGRTHVGLTTDFVARLTRVGLAAYLHALAHFASYQDWPRDAMTKYQIQVNDVLPPDQPRA